MKSNVQWRSADSAAISTNDKSPKSSSMPAVPVLQQQKSGAEDEHIQTPVQQVKAERHDEPFKLAATAEKAADHSGKGSLQPFQLKETGVVNKNIIQRKEVSYTNDRQRAAEGETHYGRNIHYITKHGPGVTDEFQKNRLLGQVRAFNTVKPILIAASNTAIANVTAAIEELKPIVDNMDPGHKKYNQKKKQLETQEKELKSHTERVPALTAILPGTPEMFTEMRGRKKDVYRDELKKPENFGAGTPTEIVTNFAVDDTAMLTTAGQMIIAHKAALEGVVGEAAAKPDEKKGIITKTGAVTATFKIHTLTGADTVTVTPHNAVATNASYSFVAQETPGTLPENVPAPIPLFVESGFITP